MPGITDPAEPYFKDGAWGWDLTQWRKLAMVFGFSAGLGEQIYDADADAGTNVLNGTVVPAGQVWVIEFISCTNRQRICTYILHTVVKSGITVAIYEGVQAAADRYTIWSGRITLAAGDYVSCHYYGCTAGDDLLLRYGGYKMYIAE